MAHVWAARALLPSMLARGEGYLLNTASAAGLLTNLGLAPLLGDQARRGRRRRVAVDHLRRPGHPRLVPLPAAGRHADAGRDRRHAGARARDGGRGDDAVSRREVAAVVVDAIGREEFLILPHPEVRDYATRRAEDNERWLRGHAAAVGFREPWARFVTNRALKV